VEEAAAAAESMQEQAQTLLQAVSVFKVADGAAASPPSVAAPPVPKTWPDVERRGPDRPRNVTRMVARKAPALPARPAPAEASSPAKTGTDGDWTEF
jgi:hypothetical protein